MKTINKFLIIITFLLVFGCTPLDTSLDGKVLTDEQGNVYKLEWQEGRGATWAFKYPVKRYKDGDTITEWRYYKREY